MTGQNDQQIADWNGVVGEQWAAEQERTDELIRPFGEAGLQAADVRTGERVIDVGCGCGDTSLALASLVGTSGAVLGVDVSAPMLAVARRRASSISQLRFEEADASRAALPGSQDLLYSRFGVMFFDDPVGAFAHMRKALNPNGRLSFVCWQAPRDNPWASVPVQAARRALSLAPAPADPHAPGPFAFADAARVKGILSDAGFRSVVAEGFEAPVKVGSTPRSAAEASARMGPMGRIAREAGPEKLPLILEAVEAALKPLAAADGQVALPGQVWVVTAKAS